MAVVNIMIQYQRRSFAMHFNVKSSEFRDAYVSLKDIIPMTNHVYQAGPTTGIQIDITLDDLSTSQRQNLMIWKIKFCG